MNTSKVQVTLPENGGSGSTVRAKFPTNVQEDIQFAFISLGLDARELAYNLEGGLVNVSIEDADGRPVISMELREFLRRQGGSFYQSCVPVNSNKKNLEVVVSTSGYVDQNITMEVVLIHAPKNTTQC